VGSTGHSCVSLFSFRITYFSGDQIKENYWRGGGGGRRKGKKKKSSGRKHLEEKTKEKMGGGGGGAMERARKKLDTHAKPYSRN